MKHLKLYESFKENIDSICQKYNIINYTINDDGSIDVDGDVNLRDKRLTELPLNFRNITGYFDCSINQLASLEGCPKLVGGNFYCHNNKLTSLEGCPESISGNFNCYYNQLKSLKGSPNSISGKFYCSINQLTTLKWCPESVGGNFYCNHNQLTSLEGCPEYIGGDFNCNYNKIITFEYLPFSISGDFYCINNPIYEIWKLFADYYKIEFLNDCDPIREPNIIILDRLNYFLEEIGKQPVTEVKGYKCI